MSSFRKPPLFLAARASARTFNNQVRSCSFSQLHEAVARAPLTEIIPAQYGDWTAAAGFGMAWIAAAAAKNAIVWSAPDIIFPDAGAPYAEGLAQFNIPLETLIFAQTKNQLDALWAAETALTLPGAFVLCTVTPAKKPLGLTSTRRLLLAAEKNNSHCILLRLDAATTSSAWTRWRIQSASSGGEKSELGAPAFLATLERNRIGVLENSWRVSWNGYQRGFTTSEEKSPSSVDVGLPAASANRAAQTPWRKAI